MAQLWLLEKKGLNLNLCADKLLDGLEAEQRDMLTGKLVADHRSRRQYLKLLLSWRQNLIDPDKPRAFSDETSSGEKTIVIIRADEAKATKLDKVIEINAEDRDGE